MSLDYIRSFLLLFCVPTMRKQAKQGSTIISLNVITNTLKCMKLKKTNKFPFFRHRVLDSMTPAVCSGCQEKVFDWIWLDNKASQGSSTSECHDGRAFTFVKMNQNPCLETTSANQPGWTVTHCWQCLMTYHLHSLGPALEVESHQFWGWYVEDWPAASWMRCCYYPF